MPPPTPPATPGAPTAAVTGTPATDGAQAPSADAARPRAFASFPDHNPNPVLRLTDAGLLSYANRAAAPVVAAEGLVVGEAAPALLERARHAERARVRFEIRAGERTFDILPVRDEELGSFNLYGTDITAVRELEATRESLVQSERMAALGRLVAGVAHELNTPLGVALTASTALEGRLAGLRASVAANTLRRAELEGFLGETELTLAIVVRSVRRSADLVRRFKGVAADQVDEAPRRVRLREQLREILAAMGPYLRAEGIRAEAEGDDATIETYPGALAQLVDNFVTNAAAHAYPDGRGGPLRFLVRAAQGGGARLVVEDDGAGMDAATLARLYEPFFTTRRGRGGTGLGMNIVHNLVVGAMGGRIEVASTLGTGTRFTLHLPAVVPPAPAPSAP